MFSATARRFALAPIAAIGADPSLSPTGPHGGPAFAASLSTPSRPLHRAGLTDFLRKPLRKRGGDG
jgi:hypothetical protein